MDIKIIITCVSVIISIASLAFGFVQYFKAQKTSRLERANTVLGKICDAKVKMHKLKADLEDVDTDEVDVTKLIHSLERYIDDDRYQVLTNKVITVEHLLEAERVIKNMEAEMEMLQNSVSSYFEWKS